MSDDMVLLFKDAPLAHEAAEIARRLVLARAEHMGEWDDYMPELREAIQSFLGVSKDMDELRHRSTYLVAALTNFAVDGFARAVAMADVPMDVRHVTLLIDEAIKNARKLGETI